jgi:hypothetical protein
VSDIFLSAVLTILIGLAAILFAVFGIFYQVYATYSVAAPEGDRAPIAKSLIRLCQCLVLLIALDSGASIYAVARLLPSPTSASAYVLAGITDISLLGIVVMTFWLAFVGMD